MTAPIDFHSIDRCFSHHLATERAQIGDERTASAIQIAVGTARRPLLIDARGHMDLEGSIAPVDIDTPFDIASLTKPLIGATLAWQAIDDGLISWDTPVCDALPAFRQHSDPRAQTITLGHLLDHSAGFRDWHPFFEDLSIDPDPDAAAQQRRAILSTILAQPLIYDPGQDHQYSDIGFIVLTHLLETLFEMPLAPLARRNIFEPLGLYRTQFVDRIAGDAPIDGAVTTEICPHRQRPVQGQVHDTNAHVMGGVSTHAGVFSTASDLLRFATHLLRVDLGIEADPIVTRQTLRDAWRPRDATTCGSHCGGWDRPSGDRSSAGRGFQPTSTVGHLGFTGTSLWLDRAQQVISVILSNRVYPSRDNDRIKDLRLQFQETILPPSP